MTRRLAGLALLIALPSAVAASETVATAGGPERIATGFETVAVEPLVAPAPGSAFALPLPDPVLAARAPSGAPTVDAAAGALTSARARILLQSLTVPGWGQATLGHNTSAAVFATIEAGIWISFAAFQVQDNLRTSSYERTARIRAGIDLSGRDDEFRRIVGSYLSSDEYNLYVVARDAASLFYDDPAKMDAYINEHMLKGADTWAWPDVEDILRYRGQRKDAQRAQQRANTTLALAIVNRIASSLHAARIASHPGPSSRSLRLEVAPAGPDAPSVVHVGVRTSF
jgi:hypothetical protein